MMNRLTFLLLAAAITISAAAIPAKRQWHTVVQPDGSQLELMLVGDENMHYYITRDGVPVVTADGTSYCYATTDDLRHLASTGMLAHGAATRRGAEATLAARANAAVATAKPMRSTAGRHSRQGSAAAPRGVGESASDFTGSKRAIVILAYFLDKSFSAAAGDPYTYYNNMLNQHGFNTAGAQGSVHDYFADMSRGQFNLEFDLYGPVRVSGSATHYGGPSPLFGGFDYAGDLISEAVMKADDTYDIDWSIYDWNNDGEVEQVFVLYSGFGQATGGPIGTVWPHAWTLDEALAAGTGGTGGISRDGVYINQYACGNELYGSSGSTRMGMGVFCHEFSHCMGLPDMYDTHYGGNYGMDDWDLLDHGSYNGPDGIGECPAAWTSYERNFAGWLALTELQPGQTVTGMKPLTSDDAEAYIIYNDANHNEYYLLENRNKESWDKYTPEQGMLIIHVDYDPLLWENNVVNTEGTFTKSEGYTANFTNDHPRMTPFHRLRSLADHTYYDTYPIIGSRISIDSLTDTSNPPAALYNPNTDGSLLMHKPITHIARDAATGCISFTFMEGATAYAPGDINGDGNVDVYDVNAIVNMILGNHQPADYHGANPDIDANGTVDVNDLNMLIALMVGSIN